jgi:hypothetical protein
MDDEQPTSDAVVFQQHLHHLDHASHVINDLRTSPNMLDQPQAERLPLTLIYDGTHGPPSLTDMYRVTVAATNAPMASFHQVNQVYQTDPQSHLTDLSSKNQRQQQQPQHNLVEQSLDPNMRTIQPNIAEKVRPATPPPSVTLTATLPTTLTQTDSATQHTLKGRNPYKTITKQQEVHAQSKSTKIPKTKPLKVQKSQNNQKLI